MLKFRKREKTRLIDSQGYVDLHTACVRANETGYFGLASRVAPESFDGENTNIDPRDCFFGGRRVDLAVMAKDASVYATKSDGDGTDGGTNPDSSKPDGD